MAAHLGGMVVLLGFLGVLGAWPFVVEWFGRRRGQGGTAMRSTLPSGPELERLLERGREERALAMRRWLSGGAARLARAARRLRALAADRMRALRSKLDRQLRRQATIHELSGLSDWILKDIGIRRSEIPYLAEQAARASAPLVRTGTGWREQRSASRGGTGADVVREPDARDLAHELRTPLTSIRSFSEILRDNPDLPRVTRERYLGIVIAESERLDRTIDQIIEGRKAA